jgi:hypothetical protein
LKEQRINEEEEEKEAERNREAAMSRDPFVMIVDDVEYYLIYRLHFHITSILLMIIMIIIIIINTLASHYNTI